MDKLDTAIARVQASIQAAVAKIQALKDGGVSQEVIDAKVESLNAASDALDAAVAS